LNIKSIIRYSLFETDRGWIGISASDFGLVNITLPEQSPDDPLIKLRLNSIYAVRDDHFFSDITKRLRLYFSGKRVYFNDTVDYSGASDFQKSVCAAARQIPYGETRSYRWVAENIGNPKSARAVGNALGKNPCPVIIPCHRVISSDGSPGGFSGGIEHKINLLLLESGN